MGDSPAAVGDIAPLVGRGETRTLGTVMWGGSRRRERSVPATTASIVALVGLAVSVSIGSWWTATAVRDGLAVWVLVRFTFTVAVGTYYMAWLRNQGHDVPAIRLRRNR